MTEPSLAYQHHFLTAKAERIKATIAEIDSTLAEIYAEIARQDAEEQASESWKD